ncbi:MAG: hypothetical protein ACFFDS_10535 [Candidatus Thorarchaeota archaeon]
MGEQRKVFILLVILFLAFSVFSSDNAFASSENWVEVVRFSYSGPDPHEYRITEPFTCDHVDWRIRWEFYFEHTHFPEFGHFSVRTYPKGENTSIDEIHVDGFGERNGTSYIFNNKGEFYMRISTLSVVTSYTIIVEQNLDSIPEFPSWILLPLFFVVTWFGIIIRKKLKMN